MTSKCRLCLDDIDKCNTFDLFQICQRTKLNIYEKLEYCCDIKINQGNDLPSKICETCNGFLDIAFNFRRMVRNTQKYLQDITFDNKRPTNSDQHDTHSNNDGDSKIIKSDYEPESYDTSEIIVMEGATNEAYDHFDDCDGYSLEPKKIEKEEENITYKRMAPRKRYETKRKYEKELSSYMCSICGNIYSKRSSFSYHMSQHREPTHECEICYKKFKQTCELKYHMRLHTGEKPYKCSYCERRFIDLGGRIRHERTHTNERPYECKICGRRFLYSWSCKKHELIHTGEKPHSCNICDKSFTLQHQLKAHLETTVHKQKEAELERETVASLVLKVEMNE